MRTRAWVLGLCVHFVLFDDMSRNSRAILNTQVDPSKVFAIDFGHFSQGEFIQGEFIKKSRMITIAVLIHVYIAHVSPGFRHQ